MAHFALHMDRPLPNPALISLAQPNAWTLARTEHHSLCREAQAAGEEDKESASKAVKSFSAALNALQDNLGQQKLQALLGVPTFWVLACTILDMTSLESLPNWDRTSLIRRQTSLACFSEAGNISFKQ